jgi:hypothetical protein
MDALPTVLCSDEALVRLAGFEVPQVQHALCQRRAAQRQRPRMIGRMGPEALVDNIVPLNVHDLEASYNGVIRALSKAKGLATKVTGIVAAADLATAAQDVDGGQAIGQGKNAPKRRKVPAIGVKVYD